MNVVLLTARLTLLGCLLSLGTQAQVNSFYGKPIENRTLSDRWELDSATRRGTFLITPYKPMFVTAGRWSSNPNGQPVSENPLYNYPFNIALGKYEAKYQLSLKVKALQGIFWGHGDLWVGYTQKSHWQIYNLAYSRPFRETNYEPELILNFATNFPFLGLRTRMLGITFNHQSNGRAIPLSRSWNRIILHAGFERGKWVVQLRPWFRLPDPDDENPAITSYVGRADALVIYKVKKNVFSLAGSHTLRWGAENRGQLQFDWAFPVRGNLRGNLQVLTGYGETLIDYNHKQTTIGLGVILVDWL